ncbi:MAG: bifunctional [glutamate--ammonia ligase]-adenylyl-L-tyrosine phosphorylase/[glutamate--ammonia-ligase] adenylyltransferase [Burkholderiaceae bacterium]
MDFHARDLSPWFARSLDALERRAPEQQRLLVELAAAPVDEAAIQRTWAVLAPWACSPSADTGTDPGPALRRLRQLVQMALMERDVRQQAPLHEVCSAVSQVACLSVGTAMRFIARDLVRIHGLPLDTEGEVQDLLVVGMGKLGGDELNVSSDIDLVYVHRDGGRTQGDAQGHGRIDSNEFFHRLARRLTGLISEVTADGFVFRVDTRLRPNGDSGPLTVTLGMLEQYFFEQGREWERFAWLKGKVIADSGLAGPQARARDEAALQDIVHPFVYRRYLDFAAIDAMRELHRLIRSEADRRDRRKDQRDGGGIDVKLGRGGIREVEFCAQLFQVVRGGRDSGLRDRRTLTTLEALAQRRLIDGDAAAGLANAYVLLRRIEHAVQYQEDAQTHRLADEPAVHDRIATMLGMDRVSFDARLDAARAQVASVFDSLLSEPATNGSAETGPRNAGDQLALDQQGQARLAALREGRRYRTAKADTRSRIDQLIELALREGRSLETAQSPDDPATARTEWLGRLIDLLETVAGRPAYLALLVQFPGAYRQLLGMMGRARWAADYLTRHPVVLDELLDGQILEASDLQAWEQELRRSIAATKLPGGEPDIERQMDLVREGHHAQVFRLLTQDLAGHLGVERLSDHLSELADRVLAVALDQAWAQVRQRHREVPRFAVIAYGRLGGKELGYASDLDLVFIYEDPDPASQPAYSLLAQRLSGWLSTRTAAGLLFEIDLRLRPNGNAGLLVSSLSAFETYQRESAWVWEHQALTRARFAAGDVALGERFEQLRRELLALPREIDGLRRDVRDMRRKMLEGHPNRSAEFDIKHDPGGMVDIEFIVQFLVLAHAHQHTALLDNAGNIALLDRAARAGLISEAQARACAQAYRDYRKRQHLLRLNDARYARVPPSEFQDHRAAVRGLWQTLIGTQDSSV